ncbi:uncharacterized protein TM_1410-like [Paramacrobiotus metropolitanus]|uniref:uncharacterized protein TM_1410-like n=1 Tax=Paramacrobiotus metropolitanus TaxID=2943436 RepID=UPI0024463547|nr:uncharacterized protein TM_1410-like [Paramacrobiotus metropolitanus]
MKFIVFLAVIAAVSARAKVKFASQFFVQMSNCTYDTLLNNPHNILIVDPDDVRLTAEQNEELKYQGKLVLAYVSVGQAEEFRAYWSDEEIDNEQVEEIYIRDDPTYPDGKVVRYWNPVWRDMLIDYMMNNVIPYNYSGVFLDYLGNYEQFPERPTAAADMVQLARSVADAVREHDQLGLVVVHGAAKLWDENDRMKKFVDGLSEENVWYGFDGVPRATKYTQSVLEVLRKANKAKKMTLVEQYVEKKTQICSFYKKCFLEELTCGVFDLQVTGIVRDCEF